MTYQRIEPLIDVLQFVSWCHHGQTTAMLDVWLVAATDNNYCAIHAGKPCIAVITG